MQFHFKKLKMKKFSHFFFRYSVKNQEGKIDKLLGKVAIEMGELVFLFDLSFFSSPADLNF